MRSSKKIVVFLLVVHFLLVFSSARKKSQTYDEAVNLASGYHYLTTGSVYLNPEHPPLIDALAALPLVFLKIDPPQVWQKDTDRWINATNFLYRNRVNFHFLLLLGRIPMMLLSVLLGLSIYLLGKKLWGAEAGLSALFLYSFSPDILAHANLITHDLGLCAMIMLTALFAWDYFQTGRVRPFIFTGIFLGFSLVSKFTALVLGPIFLFWFLLREADSRELKSLGLLPSSEWGKKHPGIIRLARLFLEAYFLACIAGLVLLAFYQFHPGEYLWGIGQGLFHQRIGNDAFLLGKYSNQGWWYYFPVAVALKTPLPVLLLIGIAIFQIRKTQLLTTGFWLVPALVVFFFGALTTINIGGRYVFPAYPFLFLAAGNSLDRCLRGKKIFKFIGVVLMGWYLLANARIYPHYLSYFNELAGGPEKGIYRLSDSNLDWGQDLIGLREYLERRGIKDVYLSYFGNWVDPADWGISSQYLPSYPDIRRHLDYRVTSSRELVAISVTNLQGTLLPNQRLYHWFWTREPVARIGYSIYVYDITGSEEAHRELEKISASAGRGY